MSKEKAISDQMVEAICDYCGAKHYVYKSAYKRSKNHFCSQSCWQKYRLEKIPLNKTHGLSNHRLYRIYYNMLARCYNPHNKEYANYHGKNITVCEEWLDKENGFVNFYKWAIENGYDEGLTLDRINNDDGYLPSNCRWESMAVQQNNKSNNRLITYEGQTHNISEWVKITGIPRGTLVKRINSGWSLKDALTKPKKS